MAEFIEREREGSRSNQKVRQKQRRKVVVTRV